MEQQLQQMLRQLPSKTEMPDLIVDISQTALATGINNELFQPGPETPKEFYAEKPIALRMVGTYHQFGAFVSGVASLPRVVILTMHDISLKPQEHRPRPASAPTLRLSSPARSRPTVTSMRKKRRSRKKLPRLRRPDREGADMHRIRSIASIGLRAPSCWLLLVADRRSPPADAASPARRVMHRTSKSGSPKSRAGRRRRWIRCR